MRIYNYLFYKTYQLAQKSGNFDNILPLGAIIYVVGCVMFNIFAISLTLEGFGLPFIYFNEEYKYLLSILLVTIVLMYYLYKGRYKNIIKKCEARERELGIAIHPFIVIFIYYGTSFGLGLLAALFKNGDWIFSK